MQIILTKIFKDEVEALIAKRKLVRDDLEDFKKNLAEYPEQGDVVPGTGGIRKTRLKGKKRWISSVLSESGR